ncbi:hypothetical protein QJS66_05050 [Kocuria rhizophila]|nr:hypothetical protein QJS66_05050 [Kocuria rhizophila]
MALSGYVEAGRLAGQIEAVVLDYQCRSETVGALGSRPALRLPLAAPG